MKDFKISKNFYYSEFVHTNHTQFKEENFEGGIKYIPMIKLQCVYILEPVRVRYGLPIIITSAYRCNGLNEYIGGSITSQHPLGEATDFKVKGIDCKKVYDYISTNHYIKYGQLILYNKNGNKFIHCSLPTLDENMQNWTCDIVDGKKIYKRLK